MIEREDTRQVTPEEQDQLRATQLGSGAVTTVLREVHSTRDTGAVMRAEILTDILAPPVRGTILMRPNTNTVTIHTGTDCHRGREGIDTRAHLRSIYDFLYCSLHLIENMTFEVNLV